MMYPKQTELYRRKLHSNILIQTVFSMVLFFVFIFLCLSMVPLLSNLEVKIIVLNVKPNKRHFETIYKKF